ncbi:protein brittle-1, chloroplastic [Musa troglodytarum]|uniref:Protein brittle-1, chloroplastic n=1 Tax=Musa troglodytarum TaxID=320322 RepID=A0A9E7KE18_9LILI|nr:protein brittle-1, chloroplastic [Musa troglodytarum]
MDLEAEAHKKKRELLVLGLVDAYGDEMAVPKELEVDKDAPAAVALRFRVPIKVGAFFFPVGFDGSAPLLVCRFRSSRLFIFEARSLIPSRQASFHLLRSAEVPVAFAPLVVIWLNFFRSREVGEFVSGALAGAMTKAVLAPLETIRTRMVVGVGSKHIAGSFLQIIEENGWQGLWAGNTVNMLRIIPTQAIELGTFECVKRTMTSVQENWKENGSPKIQIGHINLDLSFLCISPVAVGGAAAGIMSTLICHPLEVLKDRLTVNRETYPSITLALSKIYKNDGIGGLYAGLSPTLIGMLPYSTCYYFMYDTMKKSYCQTKQKKSLNRAEMLIIGALAGLTASTISFPLEVARKRLMVGSLRGKCPPHMAAALSEVVREEGLMGLYRDNSSFVANKHKRSENKDKADKFGHQLDGYLSNSILFSLPPEFCVESFPYNSHFHTILHLLGFCASKQGMNSNLSNFRIIECSSCFALLLKLHLVEYHNNLGWTITGRAMRLQAAALNRSIRLYSITGGEGGREVRRCRDRRCRRKFLSEPSSFSRCPMMGYRDFYLI